MRTVQHTYVGYKLIAITFTLLSHDNQIYMGSLVTKTSYLTPIMTLIWLFCTMIDNLFLLVKV